jgi:hypothetical protein
MLRRQIDAGRESGVRPEQTDRRVSQRESGRVSKQGVVLRSAKVRQQDGHIPNPAEVARAGNGLVGDVLQKAFFWIFRTGNWPAGAELACDTL